MGDGCKCESCVSACSQKPGWFTPEQIKKAAEYLKITEKEFFNKYLLIDWYQAHKKNDYEDVFVLSPAIVGIDAGTMFPGNPKGQCVFFNEDQLCDIHDVKPFECSELKCSDTDVSERHENAAGKWIAHQKYIEELYGDIPYPEQTSFLDSFMW